MLALFLSSLLAVVPPDEMLMIEQDFVKFGKHETYELLKKQTLGDYAAFAKGKNFPPIYAIHDPDSTQYLYLYPMRDYESLDVHFVDREEFQDSIPEEKWLQDMQAKESTINYRIFTMHHYLQDCSYSPIDFSYEAVPFVHYHIYGIVPGNESYFENHLQMMAEAHKSRRSTAIWRTWRTFFGSDVPKYVICIFAKDKKSLKDQVKKLQFVDASIKEILRRDRQGDGQVRPDLSYIPR